MTEAGEMDRRVEELFAERIRHQVDDLRGTGDAGDALVTSIVKVPGLYVTNVGLGLLWVSALVTLYTGYDYFKAGVRHLMN